MYPASRITSRLPPTPRVTPDPPGAMANPNTLAPVSIPASAWENS